MREYSQMNSANWLFYLHNFIEPDHYAISGVLSEFQLLSNINYTFAAKRFLTHQEGHKHFLLDDIPVRDKFWQQFHGLHAVFDGKPSIALCLTAYTFDVPFVLSFHGGFDTNHKIFLDDIKYKLPICVNNSRASTVICKTDMLSLVRLNCDEDKIVIIPPSINEKILPLPSEVNNSRIVTVGRFIAKKGIDTAIKAMKFMPENFTLDIIGDGELRCELHDLVRQNGLSSRINFHGRLTLSETLAMINNSSILWHPARRDETGNAEGIPQVLIYAMALKKLVIASDSGHINELINSGFNGVLIPENNPAVLAESTLRNLENSKNFGSNGRSTAESYYIDKQIQLWKNIYEVKNYA